jgi:alkylhydroperoxidase family enzyme
LAVARVADRPAPEAAAVAGGPGRDGSAPLKAEAGRAAGGCRFSWARFVLQATTHKQRKNMSPLLAPVEKPSHPMLKLGYLFTRRQFGTVPGPLSVFCARMPFAFTSFYGKVGKLDKKLTLPAGLALLIRQQVARINVCEFCIEGSRYAAIKESAANEAKFDALADYHSSPLFSESERAALDYVSEVTREKDVHPETFAALARHYDERQICEVAWLVASEHLYNLNNIALGIGAAGICEVPVAQAA